MNGDGVTQADQRRRKHKTFFLVCALAITVGTPALNRFDTSGLTHEFGLFNLSSIWRIIVFLAVGMLVAGRILLSKRLPSITGLKLFWLLYTWLAVATILAAPTMRDFALAGYRLLEWGLALFVIQNLIAGPPQEAFESFARFMRAAPLVALAVLAAVWFYDPALPYSYSIATNAGRLGGIAMHPNYLSLILGLGAIYWTVTGKGWFRYVFAAGLMVACLLTWSRSGISAAIAAMIIYVTMRGLVHRRASATTAVALLLALCGGFLAVMLNLDALFVLALRGESVAYLQGAAGRMDVWRGAVMLISESPVYGHGFIIGPKLLQWSAYIPEHWRASHAHNDLLNMAINGGIVAATILLAIYGRAALASLRLMRVEPLLLATFATALVTNIFETGLSNVSGFRGIILVALVRVVSLMLQPAPERTTRRHTGNGGRAFQHISFAHPHRHPPQSLPARRE